MLDTFGGNVNCPYCGKNQHFSEQYKSFIPQQNDFTRGTSLGGVFFLNGEYPLSDLKCKGCKKEFKITFLINDQKITDFKTYTNNDIERVYANISWKTVTKKELIEIIKKNCIAAILTSQFEQIEFDYLNQNEYYFDLKLLKNYVYYFRKRFKEVITEDFLNSIFNDLENTLDKKYLLELNIDLSQLQKERIKNSNYKSILDEHEYSELIASSNKDDLIKYLKNLVRKNINGVKNQVEEFWQN